MITQDTRRVLISKLFLLWFDKYHTITLFNITNKKCREDNILNVIFEHPPNTRITINLLNNVIKKHINKWYKKMECKWDLSKRERLKNILIEFSMKGVYPFHEYDWFYFWKEFLKHDQRQNSLTPTRTKIIFHK